MNPSGWWDDTHASRVGIETRITMACEVAEVKYGKDLALTLVNRFQVMRPTSYSTARSRISTSWRAISATFGGSIACSERGSAARH